MTHEQWFEKAELAALQALDAAECESFSAHLSGCVLCQNRVREVQAATSVLAATLAPIQPPAAIKEALLRRIDVPAQPARTNKLWGALVLAGACLAGIWLGLRPEPSPTHSAAFAQVLSEPGTRTVELKPQINEPLEAAFHWNRKHCRGCLVLKNLVRTSAGKVFQLWGMENGKPVSLGTFTAHRDGSAHVDFLHSPVRDYSGFAVTIEPVGGRLAPSTPPILLGGF